MSFPNYDSFNNQQGQQEPGGAGPGAPQQQDTPMVGQHPDNAQGQFQPGNPGDPGAAGGPQQGGEAKTTLWYAKSSFSYRSISLQCFYCSPDTF